MNRWEAFVFGWCGGTISLVAALYLLDPRLLNLVWLKVRILFLL